MPTARRAGRGPDRSASFSVPQFLGSYMLSDRSTTSMW